MKIFTFSGILDFQIFLLLLVGISECVSARYIESTMKDPDVVRFQRNTSRSCLILIESRWDKRLCHDISRGPIKSRLNEILGGNELSTCAIVLFLSRAMLYKAGYCSRRLALPSQMSSQKRTSDLSLIAKDPKKKRCFFPAIRPSQKCESPDFQYA